MNATAGIKVAYGQPFLWIKNRNATFVDLATNDSTNSTVPTFLDYCTVPTNETGIPEVVYELNWIEPLDVYMKCFFVVCAVLMAVFVIGRKVVAHVRMRIGRDLSVKFRLGDRRRDDVGAAPNRMNRANRDHNNNLPVGTMGRNVALRDFV